jgi:thioredoxin 1
MSQSVALTDSTFDATVAADTVLVDFWAEWCGPCKAVSPILDEIATEKAGALTIAKVDEHPGLAQRYEVMSIPTMLLFKDGQVQHRIVGAKGKGQLLDELARFL